MQIITTNIIHMKHILPAFAKPPFVMPTVWCTAGTELLHGNVLSEPSLVLPDTPATASDSPYVLLEHFQAGFEGHRLYHLSTERQKIGSPLSIYR